jgi:uncharacterized protein (DUF1810 family)
MWFVFPQLEGLGQSATSRIYAIRSLAEARAYLKDPVLGTRLSQICEILAGLQTLDAEHIFGAVDAKKLRSSMTLFSRAAPDEEIFRRVLAAYFDGITDAATDGLLDELNT